MNTFALWNGLLGGILIGLASTLLLLANGRIAGISGIVGGLLAPKSGETGWRAMFIIGLWLGAAGFISASGAPLDLALQASPTVMAVAGFLVGLGTRMGGGCTSGHGVCGIARLSKRSVVATLVFMVSAMATVFVVRHLLAG